jgi:hypothetical protein
LLSLPVGTEMFHFPTFPPLTLCVQVRVTGHDSCRVSPFGNPRITARLAAPRGLSQPPTSFIGSWCQGIHRAPLLTWPQSILMLASTVQFSRYGWESRPRLVAYRSRRSAVRADDGRPFDEGCCPMNPWALPSRGGTWSPRCEAANRPFPQDPTACRDRPSRAGPRSVPPEQLY